MGFLTQHYKRDKEKIEEINNPDIVQEYNNNAAHKFLDKHKGKALPLNLIPAFTNIAGMGVQKSNPNLASDLLVTGGALGAAASIFNHNMNNKRVIENIDFNSRSIKAINSSKRGGISTTEKANAVFSAGDAIKNTGMGIMGAGYLTNALTGGTTLSANQVFGASKLAGATQLGNAASYGIMAANGVNPFGSLFGQHVNYNILPKSLLSGAGGLLNSFSGPGGNAAGNALMNLAGGIGSGMGFGIPTMMAMSILGSKIQNSIRDKAMQKGNLKNNFTLGQIQDDQSSGPDKYLRAADNLPTVLKSQIQLQTITGELSFKDSAELNLLYIIAGHTKYLAADYHRKWDKFEAERSASKYSHNSLASKFTNDFEFSTLSGHQAKYKRTKIETATILFENLERELSRKILKGSRHAQSLATLLNPINILTGGLLGPSAESVISKAFGIDQASMKDRAAHRTAHELGVSKTGIQAAEMDIDAELKKENSIPVKQLIALRIIAQNTKEQLALMLDERSLKHTGKSFYGRTQNYYEELEGSSEFDKRLKQTRRIIGKIPILGLFAAIQAYKHGAEEYRNEEEWSEKILEKSELNQGRSKAEEHKKAIEKTKNDFYAFFNGAYRKYLHEHYQLDALRNMMLSEILIEVSSINGNSGLHALKYGTETGSHQWDIYSGGTSLVRTSKVAKHRTMSASLSMQDIQDQQEQEKKEKKVTQGMQALIDLTEWLKNKGGILKATGEAIGDQLDNPKNTAGGRLSDWLKDINKQLGGSRFKMFSTTGTIGKALKSLFTLGFLGKRKWVGAVAVAYLGWTLLNTKTGQIVYSKIKKFTKSVVSGYFIDEKGDFKWEAAGTVAKASLLGYGMVTILKSPVGNVLLNLILGTRGSTKSRKIKGILGLAGIGTLIYFHSEIFEGMKKALKNINEIGEKFGIIDENQSTTEKFMDLANASVLGTVLYSIWSVMPQAYVHGAMTKKRRAYAMVKGTLGIMMILLWAKEGIGKIMPPKARSILNGTIDDFLAFLPGGKLIKKLSEGKEITTGDKVATVLEAIGWGLITMPNGKVKLAGALLVIGSNLYLYRTQIGNTMKKAMFYILDLLDSKWSTAADWLADKMGIQKEYDQHKNTIVATKDYINKRMNLARDGDAANVNNNSTSAAFKYYYTSDLKNGWNKKVLKTHFDLESTNYLTGGNVSDKKVLMEKWDFFANYAKNKGQNYVEILGNKYELSEKGLKQYLQNEMLKRSLTKLKNIDPNIQKKLQKEILNIDTSIGNHNGKIDTTEEKEAMVKLITDTIAKTILKRDTDLLNGPLTKEQIQKYDKMLQSMEAIMAGVVSATDNTNKTLQIIHNQSMKYITSIEKTEDAIYKQYKD